jgi:hypothetical protein
MSMRVTGGVPVLVLAIIGIKRSPGVMEQEKTRLPISAVIGTRG